MDTTEEKTQVLRRALRRQATHWLQASARLKEPDRLMHAFGLSGVDPALVAKLQSYLDQNCNTVLRLAESLIARLDAAKQAYDVNRLKNDVIQLRDVYLSTETAVHFYTDAVNTRTGPKMASILRACDLICRRCMDETLRPLGREVPFALTFVDRGLGASILKSDLRLWNGSRSPFAAVKVTYHNLFRPTAIVHESGHQIAHIINWNGELANAFKGAPGVPPMVANAFSSWASEIAADLFAFLHTGFGSVAALRDVVSGNPQQVVAFREHDPHPIGYIRLLYLSTCCEICFGADGPWQELNASFVDQYDIRLMNTPEIPFIGECVKHLKPMAELCLNTPFKAFGGNRITRAIDPNRVSPKALEELQRSAGEALYTSHVWLHREPVRTLALNSYLVATRSDVDRYYSLQERWMNTLGTSVALN